jgi:hypothetical protein
MTLLIAPRIVGARLVAARKNPNSTQTTACQSFSAECLLRSQTVTPSNETSEIVTTKAAHHRREFGSRPASTRCLAAQRGDHNGAACAMLRERGT